MFIFNNFSINLNCNKPFFSTNSRFLVTKKHKNIACSNEISHFTSGRNWLIRYFFPLVFLLLDFIFLLCKPINISALDVRKRSMMTRNGLKYIIIENGNYEKPRWGDYLKINYVMYLIINDIIFKLDSTYDRKEIFLFTHGSGQIISGIEEAIHDMKVNEKRRILIPYSLGYTNASLGPIPPDNQSRTVLSNVYDRRKSKEKSFLAFDLELISIIREI